MNLRLYLGLGIAAVLSTSGCASAPARYLKAPPLVPQTVTIDSVPFSAQALHHCGPASLSMMLRWAGKDVSPEALAEKTFTPRKEGTFQVDLLGAARREGVLAVPVRSYAALYREVAAGNPVLVFENLGLSWSPIWHYAVVTGYDLVDKTIRLHTGTARNEWTRLKRFDLAWSGANYWGLVILSPGQLSETGDEIAHLEAGNGLERVGKLKDAESAYLAIRRKWPRSLGAAIGLGNVRYAASDARGAVEALEAATPFHAEVSALWHNLAIAYASLEKKDLARRSARKALSLASPEENAAYQKSLASVLKAAALR